jgi:hypothetical protein
MYASELLTEVISDHEADLKAYLASVHSSADKHTGLLSPGDAMRLLQAHSRTWEEYVASGGVLGSWPQGSRKPQHILGYLGY